MRWWMWVLVVAVVLTVAAIAAALLRPDPNAGDRSKLAVTFTAEEQHKIDTVSISPAQLAAADCSDGHACYIAVSGVVYDMSGFDGWRKGRHHGVKAGTDATEQFVGSGHDRMKLEGVPVVGRLAGSGTPTAPAASSAASGPASPSERMSAAASATATAETPSSRPS